MKKLIYLLFVLPLLGIAVSCDDNDLPDVNISFDYTNGTVVNNMVYVVQPDTLYIDAINVTPVNSSKQAIVVAPVNYWLDGYPCGLSNVQPFAFAIPTDQLSIGQHTLTVNMHIAQEGAALASMVGSIKINVVADSTDIPTSAGGEVTTQQVAYSLQ